MCVFVCVCVRKWESNTARAKEGQVHQHCLHFILRQMPLPRYLLFFSSRYILQPVFMRGDWTIKKVCLPAEHAERSRYYTAHTHSAESKHLFLLKITANDCNAAAGEYIALHRSNSSVSTVKVAGLFGFLCTHAASEYTQQQRSAVEITGKWISGPKSVSLFLFYFLNSSFLRPNFNF